MKLKFEWDPAKATANWGKHGVRALNCAKQCSKNPFAAEFVDDREDYGEKRFVIIDMAQGRVLLTVAYTERDDRIRLISAWRATQYEQGEYFGKNS